MNSFYHFLLVSRRNSDAFKIRDEVERNRLYQVHLIETAKEALEKISTSHINCLLFNLESFSTDKIRLITDIRDLGHRFPMMVFASYVQHEAYEIVRKMDRIVIVEKPFEAKDVWGMCQKIVQGRKVNQRIFRRFYTNQTAIVEKTTSGETLEGQI